MVGVIVIAREKLFLGFQLKYVRWKAHEMAKAKGIMMKKRIRRGRRDDEDVRSLGKVCTILFVCVHVRVRGEQSGGNHARRQNEAKGLVRTDKRKIEIV